MSQSSDQDEDLWYVTKPVYHIAKVRAGSQFEAITIASREFEKRGIGAIQGDDYTAINDSRMERENRAFTDRFVKQIIKEQNS